MTSIMSYFNLGAFSNNITTPEAPPSLPSDVDTSVPLQESFCNTPTRNSPPYYLHKADTTLSRCTTQTLTLGVVGQFSRHAGMYTLQAADFSRTSFTVGSSICHISPLAMGWVRSISAGPWPGIEGHSLQLVWCRLHMLLLNIVLFVGGGRLYTVTARFIRFKE